MYKVREAIIIKNAYFENVILAKNSETLDHKVLNKVEDINGLLAPDGVVFIVEAGKIPLAQTL